MLTSSRSSPWLIAGALLLLMAATRGHITSHLQDASWAIFFLGGFYLRGVAGFAGFMLAAFVIDLSVIEIQGIDNYCFTPAYAALVPAYGVLWAAGRWFASRYQGAWRDLLPLAGSVVIGTAACFVLSNVGFYLFSGHFPVMSAMQYAEEVKQYFLPYLFTTLFYVGIVGLVHGAVVYSRRVQGGSVV